MKNLTILINESNIPVIPETDLINDYKHVEDATGKEKKDLVAKYNSPSAKKGDIQKIILTQLRDFRKQKTSFTEEDIHWFRRLSDMPTRYKNLCEWLEAESIDFVVFMKDFYEEKMKTTKIRNNQTLFDIKDLAKGRDWNYIMTASNKYTIDTYNNFVQFITDHDPKEISDKASSENVIKGIVLKLMEQMADFKVAYLERVKKQAEKLHDDAPKYAEDAKSEMDKCSKAKEEAKAKAKENGYTGFRYYNYPAYTTAEKDYNRASNKYRFFQKLMNRNKSEYVNEEVENANKSFDANVHTLADKIKEKGLIIPDMKVSNIGNDPKIFQMLITDGKQKLYARSILAAEYSEKVTTHYRFIITNRPM